MSSDKQKVLFICTHNSCRSQIAEGLLRHFDSSHYLSYSAGIEKTKIHPLAIQVMKEIKIDISHQYSKTIEDLKETHFDYVVTVCDTAKETCPFFPGKHIIHQSFPDPTISIGTNEEKLQAFRETRDSINKWIKDTF
jgi:arsenate reductase